MTNQGFFILGRPRRTRGRCAFTLLEVLVAVGIVALLLGLILSVVSRVRGAARSAQCISTLRSLAAGFQQYAHDNGGRFPDPARSHRSWEQLISRYYRGSFACEADTELFPTVGSSYDWRDTGKYSTTLAGKLIQELNRLEAVMVFEALPGWHGRRKINVARCDGSATTVDDDYCFRDLKLPVVVDPEPESE